MSAVDPQSRVLSGMRPTGQCHIGHYHGVLKNWLALQHEYDCFFFVADWHAMATHYEDTQALETYTYNLVTDWLAVGINPGAATLFVQSRVPEHAELQLLLSMITPLSWLERVPGYKDQQEKLREKDLSTIGFLGYPLLQTADILAYRAGHVSIGADQESHVEVTREVARRFNHLYGREPGFEENAEMAIRKMGKKPGNLYKKLRKDYLEKGNENALETARALLKEQSNMTLGDQERLFGYLEGTGKVILPEPQAILTPKSRFPGLDGQKMSKSSNNTISLREDPDEITTKLRKMPTDSARIRRNDPGEPDKCPVWPLHQQYSDEARQQWVRQGCRSASIGCLDCKQPLIDAVQAELEPIRIEAIELEKNPDVVKSIIAEGSEAARDEAQDTLRVVREAIGLDYR
ncbi:tryptophan--tRNA ligase [Candidatus Sororendozoicomonas aggregata]|uniref:tryptophan--tRNA ligase n=1 Tax=Candidatus Sororendozoicomonas aggregata TaxID=3073239 RepID=UPI002ED25798